MSARQADCMHLLYVCTCMRTITLDGEMARNAIPKSWVTHRYQTFNKNTSSSKDLQLNVEKQTHIYKKKITFCIERPPDKGNLVFHGTRRVDCRSVRFILYTTRFLKKDYSSSSMCIRQLQRIKCPSDKFGIKVCPLSRASN